MNTKTFYMGLCLALVMCFFLVTPVFAAVGIDLLQGPVGTVVTVSNLPSGQSYLVQWDGLVSAAGMMASGTVTFTVPETAGGSHAV